MNVINATERIIHLEMVKMTTLTLCILWKEGREGGRERGREREKSKEGEEEERKEGGRNKPRKLNTT